MFLPLDQHCISDVATGQVEVRGNRSTETAVLSPTDQVF